MLSVRMFGVLTLSLDGQRLIDDLGPAGRILSAYLFEFPSRVHRRERLADQFWGHLDPERARAALNTAVWRLRKQLSRDPRSNGGQNLQTHGNEIVLEPATWLEIDTHFFNRAVKQVFDQRQIEEESERLRLLQTAVASYTGPFLDGDEAEWILQERERLQSLYVRAASDLVLRYGRVERYEEAIEIARQILASDPFREAIHRDILILLVLNGQRAEALLHHERWSASFKKELGIAPMPQTLRLMDSIRSGQICERLNVLKSEYFSAPTNRETY